VLLLIPSNKAERLQNFASMLDIFMSNDFILLLLSFKTLQSGTIENGAI
jgi:hypothetical protein